MAKWYILYQNDTVGPMETEQLLSYGLTPESLVWCDGMTDWAAAYTVPELMTLINANKPAPQPAEMPREQSQPALGSALTFGDLFTGTFAAAFKNIPSVFGAFFLWLLTCWIPYINVGTTIALFYGLPIEIAKGEIMNPVSIFDAKYRKFMGEFFSLFGLMMISLIPAMLFFIVPAIIIGIGWMLAFYLLLDRDMNPAEALTSSTKLTYNYKGTIFLSQLVINLAFGVGCLILMAIMAAADIGFVSVIILLIIFCMSITLGVGFNSVVYRKLVVERTNYDEVLA